MSAMNRKAIMKLKEEKIFCEYNEFKVKKYDAEISVGSTKDTVLEDKNAASNILNILKANNKIWKKVAIHVKEFKESLTIAKNLLCLMWQFDLYRKQEGIKVSFQFVVKTKVDHSEVNKMFDLIDSILFARELVNMPSNDLYPGAMVEKIKHEISNCEIITLNREQLEKAGLHLLLSVSKGSSKEPYVVIMKKGNTKHGFVGKGVTFDSGGISLKPSNEMWDMIGDMAGAATLVGAAKYLSKQNVDFFFAIGLVENMPDGESTKPGDIIESHSGKTVEILNTDAEGRLVLGDLVSYCAKEFKLKGIVTIATLTGSVKVALGNKYAALCTENKFLKKNLLKAASVTKENLYPLPFDNIYAQDLKSNRADLQNIGFNGGGTITGGMFISLMCPKETYFAHIDIANMTGPNHMSSTKYNPFFLESVVYFFENLSQN